MIVRQLYDDSLSQYTYLVGCDATGDAILFDPVRDVDRYARVAAESDLRIVAAADTHLHADYLTGLRELAARGVTVYASDAGGPGCRYDWLVESDLPHRLLVDGDAFRVGTLRVEALHTPGHAPEHLCYLISEANAAAPSAVVTGDALFVEGIGRPNLEEVAHGSDGDASGDASGDGSGDASGDLRRSLQTLSTLPSQTEVWPLHRKGTLCGYAPSPWPVSTIEHERDANPFLRSAGDAEALRDALTEPFPVPPPSFARLKRQNRSGPPPLDPLSQPQRLTPREVVDLCHGPCAIAFLDTRRDASAFLASHLPGALHVPFDASFLTLAGAYVHPDTPVYLVAEERAVDDLVRTLARIGLDAVAGWFPPSLLQRLPNAHLTTTPELRFQHLASLADRADVCVVDVRFPDAFDAAHVRGAVNRPYTRLAITERALPRDKTLLVYSQRGRRAAAAASFLQRCGHRVACVRDALHAAPASVPLVRATPSASASRLDASRPDRRAPSPSP